MPILKVYLYALEKRLKEILQEDEAVLKRLGGTVSIPSS